MPRAVRVLVLPIALLVGALAACTPGPDAASPTSRSTMPNDSPAKAGTGEVRHDLEPLASRVPALSGVADATWLSGTLGDASAPGPSLYWIDAVVTLPDGVADGLRESLELTPATGAPAVVDALEPELPAGALLAGASLDDAFSAGKWRSTAYLEADGDRLVLVMVGE